jgi:hypothetical protein
MQEPDGTRLRVIGAERVGADQLGEFCRFVRGRGPRWPHFVENDRHTATRDLPGGLGTRETAAYDMNRTQSIHHIAQIRLVAPAGQHGEDEQAGARC